MRTRRQMLKSCGMGLIAAGTGASSAACRMSKSQISISLDLEMSAEYPRRGMIEWNYRKGELDSDTKRYALQAARIVKDQGGSIHFFALGQTLEQPEVDWLKELAAAGHPIGNHTYDHINLKAGRPEELQFRFRRSPWLLRDRSIGEIIEDNIAQTTRALKERCGIAVNGFRTPGGFAEGLRDRPDLQTLLQKQGFAWVSSFYPKHQMGPVGEMPTEAVFADLLRAQAEAQPFLYETGLIEVPMSPISDVTAFRTLRWKREWFLQAIERSVKHAIRTGTMFDFLAHPSCLVVEDPKFETIQLICDLVRTAGDAAELADLATISKHCRPCF